MLKNLKCAPNLLPNAACLYNRKCKNKLYHVCFDSTIPVHDHQYSGLPR